MGKPQTVKMGKKKFNILDDGTIKIGAYDYHVAGIQGTITDFSHPEWGRLRRSFARSKVLI